MTLNLPPRPATDLLLDHDAITAEDAYRVVRAALDTDGDPRMNLATFTTTFMEPEAARLLAEAACLNMADRNTSPDGVGTAPALAMEAACLRTLAALWHAPDPRDAVGCSTVGSSEACMLGGLALKRRWRARGGTGMPNLVLGANVQVCWLKFCNYFDVEARVLDLDDDLVLDPAAVAAACDDATIGVVAVLGSTLDGSYDPVALIAAALDDLAAAGGPDVAVHVDAASGGMVAPFLEPALVWDFRLPRVVSINTSGHKYGLVYPGLGWALWRDRAALPDELVFSINYLGGELRTFGLNFSRPAAGVVGQYYEFVREGFAGLYEVLAGMRDVAAGLAGALAASPQLRVVSRGEHVPVVAFAVAEDAGFDAFALSAELYELGWQVPAYTLPGRHRDRAVLRVVCRRDLSPTLAARLVADLRASGRVLAAARPKAG